MDVQERLGQRPFECAVGTLRFLQSGGFSAVHAAVLGALLVKVGINKAVLALDFFGRQTNFSLPQKAHDLLSTASACSHGHHVPG